MVTARRLFYLLLLLLVPILLFWLAFFVLPDRPSAPQVEKNEPPELTSTPQPEPDTPLFTGSVFDLEGSPVRGARIRITSSEGVKQDGDDHSLWSNETRSQDDGTFSLEAPCEQLTLSIIAPPFRPYQKFHRRSASPVLITLEKGKQLACSVTDHQKRPIAGAEVTYTMLDQTCSAQTDAGGAFPIEGLPDPAFAPIRFTITKQGFCDFTYNLAPPFPTAFRFQLTLRPEVKVQLIDRESGAPIASTPVFVLLNRDEYKRYESDAQGFVVFREPELEYRSWYPSYMIVPEGYLASFPLYPVPVDKERYEAGKLFFSKGPELCIKVRDSAGKSVEGACVYEDYCRFNTAVSDSEGVAVIKGAASRTIQLTITKGDSKRSIGSGFGSLVELAFYEKRRTFEVVLDGGHHTTRPQRIPLSGMVVTAGGKPARGTEVTLYTIGTDSLISKEAAQVQSDGSGVFVAFCKAPGSYQVKARNGLLEALPLPLTIPKEGVTDLVLTLEPSQDVQVRLFTPDMEPHYSAYVELTVYKNENSISAGTIGTTGVFPFHVPKKFTRGRLEIYSGGYHTVEVPFTQLSELPEKVILERSEHCILRGQLFGPGGKRIEPDLEDTYFKLKVIPVADEPYSDLSLNVEEDGSFYCAAPPVGYAEVFAGCRSEGRSESQYLDLQKQGRIDDLVFRVKPWNQHHTQVVVKVRDENSRPIEDAVVILGLSGFYRQLFSDRVGECICSAVPVGKGVVRARSEGPPARKGWKQITISGNTVVDLVLHEVHDRTGTIKGTVSPLIPGTSVTLTGLRESFHDSDQYWASHSLFGRLSTNDVKMRSEVPFSFKVLEPDEYRLEAQSETHLGEYLLETKPEAYLGEATVRFGPGQTKDVTISMERSSFLDVTVTMQGKTLSGSIKLQGDRTVWLDGLYDVFEKHLLPGTYRASFSFTNEDAFVKGTADWIVSAGKYDKKRGFWTGSSMSHDFTVCMDPELTLAPGEEKKIAWDLQVGTLDAKITNGGKVFSEGTVMFYDQVAGTLVTWGMLEEGQLKISPFPAGRYVVHIEDPYRRVLGITRLTVAEGGTAEFNFDVAQSVPVTISVTLPGGQPAHIVKGTFRVDGGPSVTQSGKAPLTIKVAEGTLTGFVRTENFAPYRIDPIEVEERAENSINVSFKPGGMIVLPASNCHAPLPEVVPLESGTLVAKTLFTLDEVTSLEDSLSDAQFEALIKINGGIVNKTSLLPAGRYRVDYFSGGEKKQATVTVEAGKTVIVR